MSWSATFRVTPEEGLVEESTSNVDLSHHQDQLGQAVLAAAGLLTSNVVGGADKSYRITLSGHGNPNHEPAPGWANDFVSITIAQV